MDEYDPLFKNYIRPLGKSDYVKGVRPNVDCILCCIREKDPRVDSYIVYQDDHVFISLNKYPFNPGHLMVIPNRHIENFSDLTPEEYHYLWDMVLKCEKMLQDIFNPTGFNVGYNEGQNAGASISHVHVHVVPRYKGELGFIDVIGTTRVVVEGVESVYKKLIEKIPIYFRK